MTHLDWSASTLNGTTPQSFDIFSRMESALHTMPWKIWKSTGKLLVPSFTHRIFHPDVSQGVRPPSQDISRHDRMASPTSCSRSFLTDRRHFKSLGKIHIGMSESWPLDDCQQGSFRTGLVRITRSILPGPSWYLVQTCISMYQPSCLGHIPYQHVSTIWTIHQPLSTIINHTPTIHQSTSTNLQFCHGSYPTGPSNSTGYLATDFPPKTRSFAACDTIECCFFSAYGLNNKTRCGNIDQLPSGYD